MLNSLAQPSGATSQHWLAVWASVLAPACAQVRVRARARVRVAQG